MTDYLDGTFVYFLFHEIIVNIAVFLSLLPAVPLNIYIIYRLSSKTVKRSNYFRLIMFTRALDVFSSISGLVDHLEEYISISSNAWGHQLFWFNHQALSFCYYFHNLLITIVLIHWKTVLVKKRRLDIILYATTVAFFILYMGANQILIRFFFESGIFQDTVEYLDYTYFCVYSAISIYCYVSIRRVDTSAYSSATLTIYKRMTVVHFTQTVLVVGQFLYLHLFHDLMKRILIGNYGNEDGGPYYYFIFYYGSIDYSYVFLEPFIHGVFFYWALRGALKAAASGAATPTLATGVLRIFARRTIEQAAGTVPPEPQDPLQDL